MSGMSAKVNSDFFLSVPPSNVELPIVEDVRNKLLSLKPWNGLYWNARPYSLLWLGRPSIKLNDYSFIRLPVALTPSSGGMCLKMKALGVIGMSNWKLASVFALNVAIGESQYGSVAGSATLVILAFDQTGQIRVSDC